MAENLPGDAGMNNRCFPCLAFKTVTQDDHIQPGFPPGLCGCIQGLLGLCDQLITAMFPGRSSRFGCFIRWLLKMPDDTFGFMNVKMLKNVQCVPQGAWIWNAGSRSDHFRIVTGHIRNRQGEDRSRSTCLRQPASLNGG